MSKMPTDRTSDWRRIFDRFGRPDGVRRCPPAPEPVRPEFETAHGPMLGRPVGNVEQPKPMIR